MNLQQMLVFYTFVLARVPLVLRGPCLRHWLEQKVLGGPRKQDGAGMT